MYKLENAPNNNPEFSRREKAPNLSAAEKAKGERTAERERGQETEPAELSPEEQLKNLGSEVEARQQKIARLTGSVEATRAKLKEARENLGLPPSAEDPPSISSEKDETERLLAEQKDLEKQREELINRQEKERLVQEAKAEILQEKIDELFEEFGGFDPSDLESIFQNGKTAGGKNVESKSLGSLDPETAQSLAKAFKEGIKLLPKILEALPGLLKEFDDQLTKEATERVEKKLEEEKTEMKSKEKEEIKTEEPSLEGPPEAPAEESPEGPEQEAPTSEKEEEE